MSTEGYRPQHIVNFNRPFPCDSIFFSKIKSTEWLNLFDLYSALNSFKKIPLIHGAIPEQDLIRMHNVMTALAFGKDNVPYILVLHANKNHTAWLDVELLSDPIIHEADHEIQTGIIHRPYVMESLSSPKLSVVQLRHLSRQILNNEAVLSSSNLLKFDDSSRASNCFPQRIAIAGSQGSGLVVGKLKRGRYNTVLTTRMPLLRSI